MTLDAGFLGFPVGPGGHDSKALNVVLKLWLWEKSAAKSNRLVRKTNRIARRDSRKRPGGTDLERLAEGA